MKKLKLTKKDREKLLAELSAEITRYEEDMSEDGISFDKMLKEPAKDKIVICFTPQAYLRSQLLVKNYVGEVGWHGLIRKVDEKTYLVYDIMVYPQVVSGARTLDPTETNEWYDKYDDVLEFMHFQAHSHNTMSTTASTTDINYFTNTVKNMDGHGFKLFQIWNKSGDINSFFYDLDNNLLYDRNDIEIRISDSEFGTMDDFIKESKTMVEDMRPTQTAVKQTASVNTAAKQNITPITPAGAGYHWVNPLETLPETKIKNPFYWNNGYAEGWDEN